MDAEEFFDGTPLGIDAYRWVAGVLEGTGAFEVRVTKSQVAFRRKRGFAYLWAPGRWLARPDADVVLSIVLGRPDPSPRFKEVTQPSPRHWIHHLEIRSLTDLDDQVEGWLAEAAARAG